LHWTTAVRLSPKGTAIRRVQRGTQKSPDDIITYRRSLDGVTATFRKETIEIDALAADGFWDWEPLT